ncbi:uncharacterized protein [Rutidosis leptorrhynchoides]|uniref:uncharacterized protein n=1 Tax=Rutidosis leptorrhynchoides TaxID=125765 RepID=UPI003A9988D9
MTPFFPVNLVIDVPPATLLNANGHIADRVSFDRTAAAQVPDVTQAAAGTDTDIIFSWAWAREPMYRTQDELMLLESLIKSFQFNQNSDDTFEWSMASDGNFSVKKLTNFINEKLFHSVQSNHETLKNNLVPKKLEVFVWRTIKKRLPVRMELDKRGIDLNSLRCPICDDDLESVDHSLIFCKYSLELWNRVCKWWGFNQFGNLSMNENLRGITPKNTSMLGKKIWQAVEWVTTYYIWKNRNNKVFRDKMWTTPTALSEIQVKSFEWISHRVKGKRIEWLSWLNNPDVYLNIS